MATDWKDMLASLASEMPPAPDQPMENIPEEDTSKQKGKLRVLIDKKGRKGKTATIIEGFDIPDEEVAKIATVLKQRIAVGGSSRDGEILLQGDCLQRAKDILKELGFKL